MIEFCECANYRGLLQVKEEGGKFFWRVDCDFEETPWAEIPAELWAALKYQRSALTRSPTTKLTGAPVRAHPVERMVRRQREY